MRNQFLSFLLIVCSSYNVLIGQTATEVTINCSSSTNTIINNVATAVDPDLTLTANGNITGFTVSITDSYTSGDVLSYTGSLPSGISATAFNSNTRSLVFTGTTSAANWQDLLRRVTLQTTSATCFPEQRKVSFTVGNKYYNPLTGHFYEHYTTAKTWVNAHSYASTQSYFGMEGYLATVTSAAENNFIWKIIGADAWMGGSDNYSYINSAMGYNLYANQTASEGKWYWIAGPEKGTQFSNQNATQSGGVQAVSGRYYNWNSGEPNNSGGNENSLEIYSSGTGAWNDLPDNSNSLGCIIEFGGMPNDNTTSNMVATRTINVNGASSGAISGGNVFVCSGSNSTTLTLIGVTGSVVRWESSLDNFLTAGNSISNTTSSLTVTNISQTTYFRAIVNTTSPATCTNLNTSSVPINVTATVAGNVSSNNNSICPGSNAVLVLSGNSGSILKWQVSTSSDFSTGVTDISNTTNNLSYSLSSTGTYHFRAEVQNNGCGSSVYSSGYTITVTSGTPPVGGTMSSNEHCSGSNSGTLSLSGYTGTIQKWQHSTDGIIWTDISHTSATYNYSGITTTTYYRAIVTNGSCGTAYSSIGTVLVYGNTQYQWLGTSNTTASNTANWKCTTLPPSGADVVISSTATNDLVLDQTYTFGTITFNGADKKIILGNYDLTVTGITGSDANNYIKTNGTGKLKINISNGGTKIFPTGNNTCNAVTITNNSGSADEFSVLVLDEVYLNGSSGTTLTSPRVKRTWDISKGAANGGSGIGFVFNWNSGEETGISDARLFHYQGGNWVKQTGTTTSNSTSLSYTGYSGTFSPFAIGDNQQVLPVTLVDFTAQRQHQHEVILKWITASEQSSKSFTIEHSVDGINWAKIGTIQAIGNSNVTHHYSFVHSGAIQGVNYYRLIQTDIDGRSTYSKIVNVSLEPGNGFFIYPNPVQHGTFVLKSETAGVVSIYNNAGSVVLRKMLPSGKNEIDLTKFPKGTYRIEMNGRKVSLLVM